MAVAAVSGTRKRRKTTAKKATTTPAKKIACGFASKKSAQKAAALVRKVTGRKGIKAQGTCVVSTTATPKRRKRKTA